jgi:hypothetical protein
MIKAACYGAFMKLACLLILFSASFLNFQASSLAAHPALPVSGQDLFSDKKVEVSTSGKSGTVVVFLSAKCPCSNSHVPELNALAKAYPTFSFVAVHSNSDESADLARTYFKNLNLSFPIIQDQDSKLADQFKALKTPHAFVILASGDIVYQGGVSNSADFSKADKRFLRDALQDLVDHKNVRTSQGRTLGCIIKRG